MIQEAAQEESDDDFDPNSREQLPYLKSPENKPSIFKVIKDAIGKDLTKMAVPVHFNEPISMLQKTAEIMEYQDLLVKANREDDPVLRLIYVAVFNLAQYKSTDNRLSKPFNPILGETFELKNQEYKYVAEQVSHHPPITACYAYGRQNDYKYWMNTVMKTKFWGKSLEVQAVGLSHVKLEGRNEMYSVQRPSTIVNILGKLSLEHHGVLTCQRESSDF